MPKYTLRDNGSACRFFDGEAVLVNADTSAYYSMNTTGTYVLQELIVSGREAEDVSRALAEQFGTSATDLAGDVRSAIVELESEGLIISADDWSANPKIESDEEFSLPDVYEKPELYCHGNLEQLILSGE